MNTVSVVICLLVGFAAAFVIGGGYLKRPRK
jgi:hypothetical protein